MKQARQIRRVGNGMKGYWVEGMVKESSRAAIGAARWRSRPRRRSVDRAMLRLDFLRLYATEDVVLKRLWPAEELCFGSAHLHARIEFEGNHVQCADEIRFC